MQQAGTIAVKFCQQMSCIVMKVLLIMYAYCLHSWFDVNNSCLIFPLILRLQYTEEIYFKLSVFSCC